MTNAFTHTKVSRSQQQLDSLEIENFRAFRSLKLERLGNVNLIVGKNSVGKSALLEALRLYAAQGAPEVIGTVLEDRDEWSPRGGSTLEIEDAFLPVTNLFYGRPAVLEYNQSLIRIGPAGLSTKTLTIDIGWFVRKTDQQGLSTWVRSASLETQFPDDSVDEVEPRLIVQYNSDKSQMYFLDRERFRKYSRPAWDTSGRLPDPAFVPVGGLSTAEMARRWDRVSLIEAKNAVINALRIIVPAVENLDIIGRGPTSLPVVMAKLIDLEKPVPVRSLGEGMIRLFGLALALVTAQDTMLLVDEIDSGLHHSVQVEMWRLIFAAAERLNVQVFATTHSWDCVAAFQQVAAEDDRQDGLLIRLEKEGGEIVPILVDEETLAIVTTEQIEVR